MKKYIISLLLLFVVSLSAQAQISATTNRVDKTSDPLTKISTYVWPSITSTAGATETVVIDVSDKTTAVIQLYTGATVSGAINGATNTAFILKGTPCNPALTSFSTYAKYAPIVLTPISTETSASTQITSATAYGNFRANVTGMGKIKISWTAPDAGTTIGLVVTTR